MKQVTYLLMIIVVAVTTGCSIAPFVPHNQPPAAPHKLASAPLVWSYQDQQVQTNYMHHSRTNTYNIVGYQPCVDVNHWSSLAGAYSWKTGDCR